MDDIRREDRNIFVREWLRPGRLVMLAVVAFPLGIMLSMPWDRGVAPLPAWVLTFGGLATIWLLQSHAAALRKRFRLRKYEALWNGCVDRLKLFEDVRRRMERDRMHDWEEMPKTVERVARALYIALRRADLIADEVARTEKGLYAEPPPWVAPSHDAQAKELYRIADKNIAEYRQQYGAVMAGVQRTEAQTAVFMTTVDTLRMKMLGHRLIGRRPEITSEEFLDAMNEAKLQLAAIDTALHELELMPYPRTITIMPDAPRDADDAARLDDRSP